ncbi:hypothetical protein AD949_09200 [Acetobacter orleanensis]|nr:hypothetical protein AD949_09200 [Acetobacter orleanensis]PCD80689.1 hypothetical protein CO710_02935 [Acetobacter orleanensis]
MLFLCLQARLPDQTNSLSLVKRVALQDVTLQAQNAQSITAPGYKPLPANKATVIRENAPENPIITASRYKIGTVLYSFQAQGALMFIAV